MPRPPRLRICRSSPPSSLRGAVAAVSKRPRSSTASSSGGGGSRGSSSPPNIAWLAGEIRRLAFPPTAPSTTTTHDAATAATAAASPTQQQHQPHNPGFFPTPVFPLRSQDVTFLREPAEFYETILSKIRGATSRVTLSALYLGTGELERRLVQELAEACRRRPGLRVRILLDHSRARRGGPGRDSLSTLAPLLGACAGQAEVSLFRMPQLTGPFGRHIPSPLNEVLAVSHLKALAFDDALLLTGANLSHDYFTQRQDRYVAIQNAGALAVFYHELVALLARFASSSPSSPSPANDNDNDDDRFQFLARELRRLWGQPPYSSFPETLAAADTLAMPTVQAAPLGIRHEAKLLSALLRSHPAMASECSKGALPMELTLATAYLNPPPPLLEELAGWPGPVTLLAPAASAHGFAGATGLKSWIPLAYLRHEHEMRSRLSSLRKGAKDDGVQMYRYERPGYTFHGKGLWVLPQPLPSPRATKAALSLSVAGSSNYGFRSFERDLESQVLLLSRAPDLARRLYAERQHLLQHARPAVDLEAAAVEWEAALGPALEYPWRPLWLPRLVKWTRGYL